MIKPDRYAFNARAYPVYKACISALAWLPVFFLYFSEKLGVADVIRLEVVYFLAVVLCEVPSGYLSDRIGRRRTLLLASLCLVVAYVFFITAASFLALAFGQVFLAAGIASQSGTDTALHYESLRALGRREEYGDREARAERVSFAANASAALIGGILGAANLHWPYFLSLATALLAFVVVFRFQETVDAGVGEAGDSDFSSSFGACIAMLRSPGLLWLSAFYVVIYVVTHVPYEFYQPYLKLSYEGQSSWPPSIVSGCIFAATAFAGAVVAGRSVSISRRFGLVTVLFVAAGLELLVIAILAFWLHPLLAFVVVLRNVPMALSDAPLREAVVPKIDQNHRAMFLSLQSLSGRLAFAGLLLVIAQFIPDPDGLSAMSLRFALLLSLVVVLVAIGALFLSRRMPRRFLRGDS